MWSSQCACVCIHTCIFTHFEFVFKDITDSDGEINSLTTQTFQSRTTVVEMNCCALKQKEVICLKTDIQQGKKVYQHAG